ncbi:ArsR/SmtB family transcription factor [Patulibacter minatonensis]|uniref:ArsR/SmtB family transcription factor n=1 Tax=Patulibacter minatonensis TaxID=298163 RepID=UPI0012FCEDB7|nr:metalloregulator ArsR/SmtB family transcription factor [Patulibacter minatonensis]
MSGPGVSVGSGASEDGAAGPSSLDLSGAEELAETFRVLADPGRVRVILALLEAGEMHVGGLATAAGLSETACSHALRLLRQGRVVKRRKVGRSALYSLDDEHVSGLLGLAREHIDHARAGH